MNVRPSSSLRTARPRPARWVGAALLALLLGDCQRPPTSRPTPAPAATRPDHVELVPAGPGAVDAVVQAALASAHQQHRRLLVYVSAAWCEPCERFQKAVRAGLLDATFPDLRLLMFDHDRDVGRLLAAGYDGRLIPRFVVPDANGRGTARRTEGGTKAEDTVDKSIVPRLAQLLNGSGKPAPGP